MFKGAGMLDATRRSSVLDHETSEELCANTVGRKAPTVSDTVGLCGATINGLCAARPDCVAQT